MTAKKFDNEKARYDLIPPEMMASIADVLTYGAQKYGDRNWEGGFTYSRLFGAMMRHIWAWWSGEDKDKESGLSHLDHALACIAFLVTHERRKIGEDDRVKQKPRLP